MRKLVTIPMVVLMVAVGVPALAGFSTAQSVSGNGFSTATLQPPTSLEATASCDGEMPKVALGWVATSSEFADGYDVYRATDEAGPYVKIEHVPGREATAYTDSEVSSDATYFYALQSTAKLWTSINSNQAQATTPATCP